MQIKFDPMAKLYPFEWTRFAIYFFLCVVWALTRTLETNIGLFSAASKDFNFIYFFWNLI